ncbi:MAG: SusC/RagA family TonB-linked outer membrane protein, partial [Bacteroidales bacterium]|nr:SusC/RagA family TonB-linked outer membrane protein [Bacteroidales bacterium]
NRFFADVVLNYSGTAYLPKGDRFNFYPAINLAAIITREPYVKVYGSAGLSGADFDMEHELFRQGYGSSNGHGFYFVDGSSSSGKAEGDMAALTLAPELSKKVNLGVDAKFFKNRLAVNAEAFYEKRENILIDPSNISGVIGIGVNEQSLGEESYKGADVSINWDDKIGNVTYGVYANGGWLTSKIINDGQAYQPFDYLYHKGNRVGQRYGLEVIGIFQNQLEINNSPRQTFSDVRPGDLKYRDQNGDGVIDKQDVVKMFGSTLPLFNFGFGFNVGWKGFKVFADFQGATGVTVSLLDSPLYQPLVSNGTISYTFLSREIPWTPENADKATMPRLTTQENSNNYRANSLWYRDGSYLKLRNVGVSYTFPKSMMKLCDATVTLSATNVFSLDNIKFADPEQPGAYYPTTRVFWAGVKFNF